MGLVDCDSDTIYIANLIVGNGLVTSVDNTIPGPGYGHLVQNPPTGNIKIRVLEAGAGIAITQTLNTILISATGGALASLQNAYDNSAGANPSILTTAPFGPVSIKSSVAQDPAFRVTNSANNNLLSVNTGGNSTVISSGAVLGTVPQSVLVANTLNGFLLMDGTTLPGINGNSPNIRSVVKTVTSTPAGTTALFLPGPVGGGSVAYFVMLKGLGRSPGLGSIYGLLSTGAVDTAAVPINPGLTNQLTGPGPVTAYTDIVPFGGGFNVNVYSSSNINWDVAVDYIQLNTFP